MKVDGLMGPRMSTNLSVARQTEDRGFGARVQAGVNTAAGAVASGVGLATGMFSGGGIVSAAVSSMTTLTAQGATGNASTPYTASLPGVGGGGGGGAVGTVGLPGVGGGGGAGGPNFLGGNTGTPGSEFNGELAGLFQEQKNLLKLQAAMQQESQKYTAVSNVMKSRHETAKNAIGNIR
ncbi:MAG TPA: hypothetical protein VNA24_22965 [Hyalangium sp.]|nr:hypothetical protein [Hyalangium sp.]